MQLPRPTPAEGEEHDHQKDIKDERRNEIGTGEEQGIIADRVHTPPPMYAWIHYSDFSNG